MDGDEGEYDEDYYDEEEDEYDDGQYEEILSRLMALGFKKQQAEQALDETDCDYDVRICPFGINISAQSSTGRFQNSFFFFFFLFLDFVICSLFP